MGSGNEAPDFENPDVNKVQGGGEAFNYSMGLMKHGLPADMKKEWERKFAGKMAGAQRSGTQALKERFASGGNVPIGAMNDAYSKLREGSNEATNNFYGDMVDKDFGARQQGFGNFSTLQGIAQALSNSKNQYGMEKWKTDEEGRFKWGDFIGGLAKGAGSFFGA